MPSVAELVASGAVTKDGHIIDGPTAIGAHITDSQAALRGVPLSAIIQMAYRLAGDQIEGPAWLADTRFDVIGRLAAGSSKEQVPEMLQALLADRFKMTVHHEEKIQPVYLLMVGRGPLKLKPTAGGDVNSCNGGPGGHHTCQNLTMEAFAQFLCAGRLMAANMAVGANPVWLDRPVINKTGLQGAYDFTLDFGLVGSTEGRHGREPIDPNSLVPLSQAVKDLGFALQPDKARFDVLVVDHIERAPTEN